MKTPTKTIHGLLDSAFWPEGLEVVTAYDRLHDDHDGTYEGRLVVTLGRDGDAHLTTDKQLGNGLRFRSGLIGGGQSDRTRNALLILAEAMRLDNIDHPQSVPPGCQQSKMFDDELRKLFHELWTASVGQPGYDKAKWRKLQDALRDRAVVV